MTVSLCAAAGAAVLSQTDSAAAITNTVAAISSRLRPPTTGTSALAARGPSTAPIVPPAAMKP